MSTVNVNLQDAFAAPANVLVTIKSVLVASQNVTVGTSGVLPFKASGRTNASGSVAFVLPTGRYQISASSPTLDGVPYQPLIDVPNDAASYEHTQLIVSGASPFTQPISTNVNASDATFGLVKLVTGAVLPARVYTQAQLDAVLPVNVLAYGADPTGVSDSRTAFVNALAAVPVGGTLSVPAGTYLLASALTITKNDCRILGAGAGATTIRYSGAADIAILLTLIGDRQKLERLTVDGASKSACVVKVIGDYGYYADGEITGAYADADIDPGAGTIVSCMLIYTGSVGGRIERMRFANADHAVAGSRSSTLLIFTDFNGAGWTSADNCQDWTVIGCSFKNVASHNNNTDGNCIQTSLTQNYNSNIRIIGCEFEQWGRSAIKIIGNGVSIAACSFDNSADTGARTAVRIYGRNNTLNGFTVKGQFAFYGVEVGTTAFDVSENVISNGSIQFAGTPSGGFPIGIFFEDNTFKSGCNQVAVENAAYHTKVIGNVQNCGFSNLIADTIANDVIAFAINGGNSPKNCSVNGIQGSAITGQAFNAANGTNLSVGGIVQVFDGSGALKPNAITYASGVAGSRSVTVANDGVIVDWNGDVVVGGMRDDCISAALTGGIGWTASTLNSGTAAVSSIISANHSGLYAVSDGGNAAGVGNIRTSGTNILFGTKKKRYIACVHTPTALSDATDTYEIFHGFGDATTAANTDGAFFDYTHSLNSGNWTAKTCSGGVFTTASGGSNVAVTANADWWLGIEADSTSVKFYVAPDNGGVPGAWVLIGTSTTNLPTSGATGLIHEIISTAGTRTDTFYMDLVILRM